MTQSNEFGEVEPDAGTSTARTWMVHDQGRQFGPHTEMEVAMLFASGSISSAALAWREGSPRWIPITAIVPMPPRPPAVYSPPPAEITRVTAGILAILLGVIGVHKFILGRTAAGLAMLLISLFGACCYGIGPIAMGTIGLIEGIIYLTKTDAQFYQDYVVTKRDWF